VTYGSTIKLHLVPRLPEGGQLWPAGYDGPTPSVRRVAPDADTTHLVAG
jgi:hypothetical protein